MPRWLRACFLLVDLGFILYWAITAAGVLPEAWLFKDYQDPLLQAWNWSFLPLDLFVSATGLTAVLLARWGGDWRPWALLSLAMTSASGMQAIAFWVLRQDFDPAWWLPNLFLLLYPIAALPAVLGRSPRSAPA